MKRQVVPVVVLMSLVIVAVVVLANYENREGRKSSSAPPLKIAMSGQYPPFNYFDDENRLVGFDVDIASEVARRLGRPPKLITTAWDGIIAGLLAGKFDLIIGSMAITEERKKAVNFSDPYYISGAQLFVRKGSKILGKQDLRGTVVGVTLGTTYEQAVRKIKGTKVSTYDGVPDMYLEMDNKHIDGFVTDRLVGLYGITRAKRDFVPAGDPLYTEVIGIAMRRDHPELLAAVNEALAAMRDDGTYAEISTKWFGRDISATEE
ncbi:MAG: ABC transporter substrate-binding protein [Armatimonadota bacterium]